MKGVVFTEFLNMMDERFGPEMTETLILSCDLPSGGAYTSVATYDDAEIFALLNALSKETKDPVPKLLKGFGHHLFDAFHRSNNQYATLSPDVFHYLEQVDGVVHRDVKKLYADSSPPSLKCHRINEDEMEMTYRSNRALADLAEGLIEAAIAYFGDTVHLTRQDHDGEDAYSKFYFRREQVEANAS